MRINKYPKVSIIIPLYIITDYFYESVEKCLALDYPDYEILIGVDHGVKLPYKDKRVRVLETGQQRTGPAEKRDIGIIKATGEYIAFLDDDSYPQKDWLKKATAVLRREKVEAVGGPGLTPPADDFAQKITGALLSSPFGSGPYFYRFEKGSPRYVDDFPAYNLIVDRKTLLRVGNFGNKYYGGEDTALCLKLVNSGAKIYYHPDIVVYHHRRAFPGKYIKQVGNVGKHRGYFVKKYPQTSLRFSYFGPAVFLVGGVILTAVSFFSEPVRFSLIVLFILGYLLVFIESLQRHSVIMSSLMPFAVITNYIAYGYQFIKGLFFTKHMDR